MVKIFILVVLAAVFFVFMCISFVVGAITTSDFLKECPKNYTNEDIYNFLFTDGFTLSDATLFDLLICLLCLPTVVFFRLFLWVVSFFKWKPLKNIGKTKKRRKENDFRRNS